MRPSWTYPPVLDLPSAAGAGSADDSSPSPSPSTPSSCSATPTSRRTSVFHRVRVASAAARAWRSVSVLSPSAAGGRRIVVYLTSLRVVRKTFEDCRAVISILRGLRVAVDERDLSMDPGFLAELKGVLGRRQLSLPRVFVGGRYLGGADEFRHLHETGELHAYINGVPPAEPVCCFCGGYRFILCQTCDGSHKCYCDKSGFRICTSCNENGLVRCPQCCTFDAP